MPVCKCGICGGKLNITLGSDIAVCGSCANRTFIPADEVKKYSDIYKTAETHMSRNSIEGYTAAINLLQTISFIPEAERKTAFCEERIKMIEDARAYHEKIKSRENKSAANIGVILLVLLALLCLAAVAGICDIAVHLYRGDLSPGALKAIVAAVAVVAVIAVIGKLRS